MFDGRHCTEKDLKLLTEETDRIKPLLKEKNDYSEELDRYIDLVARFDVEIANKIKRNPQQLNTYIEELIQNIIVDINEHQ